MAAGGVRDGGRGAEHLPGSGNGLHLSRGGRAHSRVVLVFGWLGWPARHPHKCGPFESKWVRLGMAQ